VSAEAEESGQDELAAPLESYDRVLKTVHWSTLLLIAAAYIAIWGSYAVATKEQEAFLTQLHRSLGVTVFVLTVFRLGWRWHARIPSLPADLPAIQKAAARVAEYVLYALLLLQPILGILYINAGEASRLFLSGRAAADCRSRQGPRQAGHRRPRYRRLRAIDIHCAARGRRALPPLCPA
jgi:cytochrome b561